MHMNDTCIKIHYISLRYWKSNYILDITLKTILSIFLSNHLTLSSISSRDTNNSSAICMEKDDPLQRLQEQTACTYLFNQFNPVHPLRCSVINIHFNVVLNLGLGPKNQSNSEALCNIS
jgi:hypothetical protein